MMDFKPSGFAFKELVFRARVFDLVQILYLYRNVEASNEHVKKFK